MARVTVEDCITKVDNRFDLVLVAGQRARHISAGAPLEVERDNDKNTVVALREIAEDKILSKDLRDVLIQGLQKHVVRDDNNDDLGDVLGGQEDSAMSKEAATEAADMVVAQPEDGMNFQDMEDIS